MWMRVDCSHSKFISSDSEHVILFSRERTSSDRRWGAFVLGSSDEGQIPAVCPAGAEPEHGEMHPGHNPEVKSWQKLLFVKLCDCTVLVRACGVPEKLSDADLFFSLVNFINFSHITWIILWLPQIISFELLQGPELIITNTAFLIWWETNFKAETP